MRLINYSFDDPAENLALEEVLLDRVETGEAEETLRFWESPVRFVVIGTGQTLAQEVHIERCQADGIPFLRRCTAGGAVLQGPGCLNYTLALRYENWPSFKSLHTSYATILECIADALVHHAITARFEGICDLALDGGKVSGNAQRRRRNAMLHHGTLLYRPDYEGMERYLREPEDRPDYRGARNHRDFVGHLPLDPDTLRVAVCEAFDVAPVSIAHNQPAPTPEELDAARRLAVEKYRSDAWTRRR
ncbi:MAG TPA: lipoate--protein ligase family protein [Candidatus Hydrogenedentes bacterium]|nr:lipoate--protein ligase family protein [Candidatus Hydrogenedentota bacterium]